MSDANSDYVLPSPKVPQNIESADEIFRDKLTEDEQKLYLKLEQDQIKEMHDFFLCYVDDS